MAAPAKFQNPSFKFQGNAINQDKGKKTERKPGFILFLLEFDYSLEFGFWNLEFLGLRA
ncbi:MAG: hypothetical protein KKC28_04005 [Verrucomicrobia bacterium]|nr:hypothetical protein [Verrucomicrobiota bacterium]MBU1856124.1 hypothetical protein [Verrucomicrobiota bacterium]